MEVCPAAGEALWPDLSTFNKQLEENRVGREKATYKYIAMKELDLLSLKAGSLNGYNFLIRKTSLQKVYKKLHQWSIK